MNTYLLYRNRDWKSPETYFDYGSIVQDLSLHILFRMASRAVIYERDEVKGITETDPFLQETMKRVMGVSLETYEEIAYRQEILKDCLNHEQQGNCTVSSRIFCVSGPIWDVRRENGPAAETRWAT